MGPKTSHLLNDFCFTAQTCLFLMGKRFSSELTMRYDSSNQLTHFYANRQVTECRFLRVNYKAMVDWRQHTDYLRCSPRLFGVPRFDCVFIQMTQEKVILGLPIWVPRWKSHLPPRFCPSFWFCHWLVCAFERIRISVSLEFEHDRERKHNFSTPVNHPWCASSTGWTFWFLRCWHCRYWHVSSHENDAFEGRAPYSFESLNMF